MLTIALIDRFFFLVSVITNAALIGASCGTLSVPIGHYKYLHIQFALFNILHSICHVIAKPRFHQMGLHFLIVSEVKEYYIGAQVTRFVLCALCGFYTGSLAIFGVHFYYRYTAMENTNVKLKRKTPILVAIPIIASISWSALLLLFFGGTDEVDKLIGSTAVRPPIDISNTSSIVYFETSYFDANYGVAWHRVLALCWYWFMMLGSLFVVVRYLLKSRNLLINTHSTSSSNVSPRHSAVSNVFKQEHKQYLGALVFQIAISTILLYFPVFLVALLCFLGSDIGFLSLALNFTIGVYPAFDPIPTFLIVRSFRIKLFSAFRCCAERDYVTTTSF